MDLPHPTSSMWSLLISDSVTPAFFSAYVTESTEMTATSLLSASAELDYHGMSDSHSRSGEVLDAIPLLRVGMSVGSVLLFGPISTFGLMMLVSMTVAMSVMMAMSMAVAVVVVVQLRMSRGGIMVLMNVIVRSVHHGVMRRHMGRAHIRGVVAIHVARQVEWLSVGGTKSKASVFVLGKRPARFGTGYDRRAPQRGRRPFPRARGCGLLATWCTFAVQVAQRRSSCGRNYEYMHRGRRLHSLQ